jgi:predicted Rossmann fold nucleotide-binding protein DprA/Smf involved in DNA uptake
MNLSDNAKAIMLLCARLNERDGMAPLTLRGYNALASYLHDNKMEPCALFSMDDLTAAAQAAAVEPSRLSGLLGRGVQLGFSLDAWERASLWVVCRCDPDYPSRLKNHLKSQAPPFLVGTGNRELLAGGGYGVVGSRHVDQAGTAFAETIAKWCAQNGQSIISGGARGVDSIAMQSALSQGGASIGILADSLLRASVSKDWRWALGQGKLLLLSPYHPEAGFNVGNAMGRNKLIYAMSDAVVIVSAEHKKGGTWAGAEEEMKRTSRRRMFVRLDEKAPLGNRRLIELGATPFDSSWMAKSPTEILAFTHTALDSTDKTSEKEQKQLFIDFATTLTPPMSLAVSEEKSVQEEYLAVSKQASVSAYQIMLPHMRALLEKPQTKKELSERIDDLSSAQLDAWLKRAVKDKQIAKRGRPIKYVCITQPPTMDTSPESHG